MKSVDSETPGRAITKYDEFIRNGLGGQFVEEGAGVEFFVRPARWGEFAPPVCPPFAREGRAFFPESGITCHRSPTDTKSRDPATVGRVFVFIPDFADVLSC